MAFHGFTGAATSRSTARSLFMAILSREGEVSPRRRDKRLEIRAELTAGFGVAIEHVPAYVTSVGDGGADLRVESAHLLLGRLTVIEGVVVATGDEDAHARIELEGERGCRLALRSRGSTPARDGGADQHRGGIRRGGAGGVVPSRPDGTVRRTVRG